MQTLLERPITLRCPRCATILRSRNTCPSCGRDLNQADADDPSTLVPVSKQPGEIASVKVQHSAQPQPSPVPPKPALTLCSMCLSSVSAEERQSRDGKPVCNTCAHALSKSASTTVQNTEEFTARPAIARKLPVTSQRVVTSVTPAEGQNDLKFNRYHEEQLKKKLSWVKIVLFIGALVLGLTGGGSYLMGDLSAKAAGTSTAEDEALEAMEEAGSDAEANAIRKQEQAEARDTLRKAGQHLKVMALVQLLLAGAFITMIFLTNSFPFEISLAALLLYIGLEVWSVASEGELPSLMGCLIIVVIAGNLAAGVHAGWQIRTLRAAK